METELYKELNKRIEEYNQLIKKYNNSADYLKAAEYSFKISEILSIQMLMLDLNK